jgi:hypothetical protein
MTNLNVLRRAISLGAALLVLGVPALPRAQAPGEIPHSNITYILPLWNGFSSSSDAQFDATVADLDQRIPEGPRVKVGFTVYIGITMTNPLVDPADPAAVRAALAGTFAQMDAVVERARGARGGAGIPLGLSFLTAIRDSSDAVEIAGQSNDRRNAQWYSQNGLASGWSSYSRYARKQRRLQEAYMREVGRRLATRVAEYPETIVAASGDGEIELAYDPAFQTNPNPAANPSQAVLADYSPFTIAEFRDWVRQGGLYAPGQPFAGQAWEFSSRYANDASPAVDSNGDGHTLNGDFLAPLNLGFSTWDLKHFDWTLGPTPDADTGAIPVSTYGIAGWSPTPNSVPAGFDAPRSAHRGESWWELWALFRQRMVWRHNIDVARWMTTTPGAGGATVPPTRWYSDQIPADYLFGFTPANPNFRLLASASPWWTSDVRPYGSVGITSFNQRIEGANHVATYYRTLPGVFPQIAKGNLRWGILEWSPSVPSTTDPAPYRADVALLVQHRPSVLVPFTWDHPDYPVKNTGFEVALRELAGQLGTEPLTLSTSTLQFGMTANGSARTPTQNVGVSGAPGEHPAWSILSASPFLAVAKQPDGRTFSVAIKGNLPAGITAGTVVVTSSDPTYRNTTLSVIIQVPSLGTSTAPIGVFDTPVAGAVVSGEIGVTGWAVDDIGIAGVDIYRSPRAGEPRNANGLVKVGDATLVAGARSDVQAAYSTRPMSEKAGWGYMLLTNMLPGGGNGAFTLHAFARDFDGHSTLLGSRVITATNASASLPFGTIDTPMQGQTVSGTIINFGWALTPQPNTIPVDGSTISVYVDDVFMGHPVYGNARSDIQTLFPGYSNTDGAVGYFMLDTTLLTNGVHTIAWGVVDNMGNAQGIGSRYFTVSNP